MGRTNLVPVNVAGQVQVYIPLPKLTHVPPFRPRRRSSNTNHFRTIVSRHLHGFEVQTSYGMSHALPKQRISEMPQGVFLYQ